MSSPEDPLYIVPAVLPDDTPVKPVRSRPKAKEGSPPTESVVTANVHHTGSEPITKESATRAIRFERSSIRRRTRIVRHIDPWSVFRVALAAHFVLYLVLLLAGVLLWNVANATGTVDNVERFMESFGWETFEFDGGELFHQAWILGLFAVVGLTGLAVLVATTFNLITDLVGGVRVTVIENRARPRSESPPPPGKTTRKSPTDPRS